MRDECAAIRDEFDADLQSAVSENDLYQIKSKYLGRSSRLTSLIKSLKDLPAEERALTGSTANALKSSLQREIETALEAMRLTRKEQAIAARALDITLPGRRPALGTLHPVTRVTEKITAIFTGLGFSVVDGPEIELDFFNFEALNIPKDHPARDMHDTFYVSGEQLLRTHTSPVQIRTMQRMQPPLRILCPGKVYRCDSDISHTPMFHQIEGLMVDTHVSFSDLKGLLTILIHRLFGQETAIRFRPSYFPFTEPSAEVDIQCVMCRGNGCRVCSGTGWLEILGCGLVNPVVFKNAGYDPEEVTGLAFGLGVERIAMLTYGINDIRLFYENDLRFLSQF
ncbi:MAG: phenylalanine--tRNA ligase subunit alpha [Deltaproteobacteria bacterium]|nr:phenylalanine--tRNA ligase subunit alpha [Deltaproteobacteria bacterium]